MLAKAGVRVLGIKRIDEERVAGLHGGRGPARIQRPSRGHFPRDPAFGHRWVERTLRVVHAMYFTTQSTLQSRKGERLAGAFQWVRRCWLQLVIQWLRAQPK